MLHILREDSITRALEHYADPEGIPLRNIAFAKQKGFGLILDGAKLEGAGLILAVDLTKVDVTKEFITFYNARPAGTASTTTPK